MTFTRLRRAVVLAAVAAALPTFVVSQASATTPGQNGLIAFSALAGDTFQLYTVRPNGHGLRQLTHLDFDAVNPDWSPDGRRIVFEISTPDDCQVVALVNADGSDLEVLSPAASGCESQPAFTPDGRRIVFQRFAFDPCCDDALWSMNLDGGDRHRITDGAGFGATDPNVSPDGTLSYVGFNGLDFGQGLFTTSLGGGGTQQVVPYSADVAIKHDWAPDGRRLVFTDNADFPEPGDSANIATVRPDGSGLRYLTHFQGGDVNAFVGSYSPDGHWIVFRLEDHGSYGLYRMRPDGGALHPILGLSSLKPRFIDWGPRIDASGDED